MPMTISGTSGVTFPDSTLQTTAASVSNALGGVGSYCLAATTEDGYFAPGTTKAGSLLRYGGFYSLSNLSGGDGYVFYWQGNGGTPSGTWRSMGVNGFPAGNYAGACLWVRIS
jgi:hypothetical protein